MSLSPDIDVDIQADIGRRFSGLDRLYGLAPADAVRKSHVAVVGIGGVGSWTAEALARSGVGRLTLIDMDHIAESNINRQVHALSTTVGMSKIEAMRQRIALINPQCDVGCIDAFAEPANWPAILPSDTDAVVDACDQVRTKTAIAAWARHHKSICISVGAAGGKRHAHLVDIADLSDVSHDPLLAQVRYQLRKHHAAPKLGKKLGVACVFSREAVAQADASCAVQGDATLNCHGYGSTVTVTASFGLCAAGWVMDKISQQRQKSGANNAII
jgi:tRNA A37 threonylcarbamoyladenosine dehydratase